MNIDVRARRGWALPVLIGASLACAILAQAPSARADAPAPVKIAIFDFELEDFSAAGGLIAESPEDSAQLKLATDEARKLIAQSGRYSLVDPSGADADPVKARSLRDCNGCDAAIALKLGADESMIGVVKRISRMEYVVDVQIRDGRDGAMIFNKQTDLRMGANYAWSRGVNWLVKNDLLSN
jgi:hypothetical protein